MKAEPVQGSTKLIWSEGEIPSAYSFEGGWIVLSNVGIHAAQMTVTQHSSQFEEIWNIGMAGALREELPIGEIVTIERVGKYVPSGVLDTRSQEYVLTTVPSFFIGNEGSKLISSDFPIHDHTHRNPLGQEWDLVDMEGYGIAYAAYHLGKKCKMWKIISDFASPGGRELIRKHRTKLSEMIAEKIHEAIHESSRHP